MSLFRNAGLMRLDRLLPTPVIGAEITLALGGADKGWLTLALATAYGADPTIVRRGGEVAVGHRSCPPHRPVVRMTQHSRAALSSHGNPLSPTLGRIHCGERAAGASAVLHRKRRLATAAQLDAGSLQFRRLVSFCVLAAAPFMFLRSSPCPCPSELRRGGTYKWPFFFVPLALRLPSFGFPSLYRADSRLVHTL